jgi:hypothetical protein
VAALGEQAAAARSVGDGANSRRRRRWASSSSSVREKASVQRLKGAGGFFVKQSHAQAESCGGLNHKRCSDPRIFV